ncbi:MAG: YbfB/YjiJ family MFS transporter [Burkholderiales bacterium]|nr:YbfB/YjiJ family MFS transporter [Burkholderiales bacterium]
MSNSFARFAYALVLPAMREDLAWNYTQAGALNTANAIGYLIGAVATRMVIRRCGNRALFIGGVLATALAVLATGLTRDLGWLGFWRLASGVTGAAAFIAGGALSGNVVPARPHLGAVTIAIYFGGGGIGFLLCGVSLPLLLDAAGAAAWPRAWVWMGVAGLAMFGASAWAATAIAEPNQAPEGPGSGASGLAGLGAGVFAYLMFGLGYIGYMTFVIAWMRDHGASTAAVVAVWLTFGIASLAGPWAWGVPLRRWVPARVLAAALGVLAAGAVLPLVGSGIAVMLASALLFGGAMWNIPGSVTSLAKRARPKHAWGATVAAFTIVFAAGQIAGPVATGFIADRFGGLAIGLGLSVAVLAVGALAALAQRDVVHRDDAGREVPNRGDTGREVPNRGNTGRAALNRGNTGRGGPTSPG